MNLDLHLIHTCDTLRATLADDRYNNKSRTFAAHLTDQRCRLVETSERVVNSITTELMIVTTYKLLVPFDADIVAGDRVSGVVLEDGEEIDETFAVQSRLRGRSAYVRHRTLMLKKVL